MKLSKLPAIISLSCFAMPSAVFAQDGGAALEEIVVTATKRAKNLQEVPVAVSAISAQEMKDQGVFQTNDLNRTMPNIQVSSPYGEQQPNFSLRGVGVGTEFNSNTASPIGVYVDEVYQAFRAAHGQQLYDLIQVEVVRGPQGTLYGRNTTGGAINFITRKPELDGDNGYLTVGFGNYSRRNVTAAYEFNPSDSLGIRVSGNYVDSDPYMTNQLDAGVNDFSSSGASGLNLNTGRDPGGSENYGARLSVRWLPTENLDFTLKAYSAEAEGGTEAPFPVGQIQGSDLMDFTSPNFLLSPLFDGQLNPENYSISANGFSADDIEMDSVGEARTESEGIVFSAEIAISDDLKIVNTTGYDSGLYSQQNTDCDGSPLRACSIGYSSDFRAFNQDIRLDYVQENFSLLAGLFYGNDVITSNNTPDFFNFLSDNREAVGLPADYFNPGGFFSGEGLPLDAADLPTGIRATQSFRQERTSYAVYAEGNYQLTDALTLTVGARFTKDENDFTDAMSTFYDDNGVARLITVSGYQENGAYAPYFLEDLKNPAGDVVVPGFPSLGLATPEPLKKSGDSESTTGRVILDYKPNEDSLVYASLSRGYRAGTFNGLAYGSANQVYFVPPEEVDAYELGFKTRLLDDRLQLNGAIFRYDYIGQQGQVIDDTATGNLVSLDGEITGLELDIKYAVNDAFTLNAAIGLLDSEYDDGDCPADSSTIPSFPAQIGSCIVSAGGPVSVAGNPMPYAAEESLNIGFNWRLAEMAGGGELLLYADTAYTGDFSFDSFEDYSKGPLPNVASGDYVNGGGDYWVSNARLTYEIDNIAVSAWVKNIGDKLYFPYGISLENLFGNGYRVRALPRTFGVEATYRF